MAQFLRPIADEFIGLGWDSPAWDKLDEGDPPSGDTVTSNVVSPGISTSDLDLQLNGAGDPESSADHVLRAHWRETAGVASAFNAHLELWQGAPGTGTLLATLTAAINNTLTTYTYTLTTAEADSITNYSNLYLSVWGTSGSLNLLDTSLEVDFVELEVPDHVPASFARAKHTSFPHAVISPAISRRRIRRSVPSRPGITPGQRT